MQNYIPRHHGHTTSIKINMISSDQITKDNPSMQTYSTNIPNNLTSSDQVTKDNALVCKLAHKYSNQSNQ
jgi:hypothetical protein